MKRWIKRDDGFTLAETLLAVLIMSIIFTAVGGGVVVMKNNYEKVTQRAQAQVLLATTVSAINADLESVTIVNLGGSAGTLTEPKEVKCFYSTFRNSWCMIANGTNSGSGTAAIQLNPTDAAGAAVEGLGQPLVSDAAVVKGLSTNLTNLTNPVLQFYGDPATDKYSYFEYVVEVKDKHGRVIETKKIKVSPLSSPSVR